MLLDEGFYFWLYVAVWMALIVWADLRHQSHIGDFESWKRREELPSFIEHSTLVGSEISLSGSLGDGKWQLSGRADQIMLTKKKHFFIIDTKLRKAHRVYEEDIIQVSLYRHLLTQELSVPVCDFAYVRTVKICKTEKSVRYHKVDLMDANQLQMLCEAESEQESVTPGTFKTAIAYKKVEKNQSPQFDDKGSLAFFPVR